MLHLFLPKDLQLGSFRINRTHCHSKESMEKKIFRFCEISSCKHRLRLRISSSGKAAKARTKRQEPGEISMWKTRAKRLGAVLGLFSIGWTVFDWHQDSRGFWAYQGLLEFENSVVLNCSLATCWASSEESCIHPTQPRSVRMGQGYISYHFFQRQNQVSDFPRIKVQR